MFGGMKIIPYICEINKIDMSKKINLTQVAHNSFPDRESGFAFQDLDKVTQSYIVYAMENAIKLSLELASDNGEVVYMSDTLGEISLSISERKKYILKKSSIIDTINEIER
jgi:hypothetical protein